MEDAFHDHLQTLQLSLLRLQSSKFDVLLPKRDKR